MALRFELSLRLILLACVAGFSPFAVSAQEEDEMYQVMPLPASRDELADRLTEAGMSPAGVAAIIKVTRDGQVLETTPADEAGIAIGATKVGGLPDLPRTMSWPERPAYDDSATLKAQYDAEAANLYADAGLAPPWMGEQEGKALVAARKQSADEAMASTLQIMKDAGAEIDEKDLAAMRGLAPDDAATLAAAQRALGEMVVRPFPLPFVAQIDLASLSGQPGFDKALPTSGRLLFFYDMPVLPPSYEPRGKAGWKLIYDDSPASELERKPLPKPLLDFSGPTSLKAASVTPRAVTTTVPIGDAGWDLVGDISGDDVSIYSQWLFTIGWPTAPEGGNHQLGGWPRAIQSGMQTTSQLASHGIDAGTEEVFSSEESKRLLPDAKEWRLVLQIGTDEAIGYPYSGALYVLMRDEDLAARRFDKAWVVYEQD